MGLKTKLSTAKPGSSSLRATVPEGIVEFLGAKSGNELDWDMKTEGEKRFVVVRLVGQ